MATIANGTATSHKKLFSLECGVTTNIQASADKIWGLLTDASAIPNWNSTIISLEGEITLNNTIHLKSTSDPKRTFNLKVSEMTAPTKMVWGDGQAPFFKGVRTYTLTPKSDGSTNFTMREVFSGIMIPMIVGSLPDFKPVFEQFAADLKKAAEQGV